MKPTVPTLLLTTLFIVFSITGAVLMTGSTAATHPFRLLFALMFFIGAVAIAARPIVYVLTRKSGSLFFPDDGSRKPPPAYSAAQAYRIKGDFAGALRLYEQIVATHPHELRAYVAIVEIALGNVGDAALAQRMLDSGLAAIPSENNRRHLQESYDEALALRDKKRKPAGRS